MSDSDIAEVFPFAEEHMDCNDYVQKYVMTDKSHHESMAYESDTSASILSDIESPLTTVYVPHSVSIGLFHYNKEQHSNMERTKCEAVSRVVARILLREGSYPTSSFNKDDKKYFKNEMVNLWKEMERKFTERADDIKQYYNKESTLTNDILGIIMVRDACFILEFFRCLFNESVGDCDNLKRFFPEFGSKITPVVRLQFMKDLIKLGNQIPLFVLEEVLAMEMGDSLEDAKSRLQLLLKAVFHKFYYRPFDYVASGKSLRRNHILDVYYYYCLGGKEPEKKKRKAEERQEEKQKAEDLWVFLGSYVEDSEKNQSERLIVPSADRLEKGGVKIQATGKTLEDIWFDGRTLYMPPIKLQSDSIFFIRNLIALETGSSHGSLKRMTAFAEFMNELCRTEKGTEVMRENGVIVGNLWQHSQNTELFRSSKHSHSLPSQHPIQITRKELSEYYSKKGRIAAAEAWNEFRRTYFWKPWFLIGGIGATIILILTAVQVFCLFHSCGAH